ncbi:MAG: CinA family protein [Gammaproteobacteria bacterium]|nr:CinA family protein [Gammaproteobacteria bacterium]
MDEPNRDEHLAERLGALLRGRGERCVSAESCTGGGIAWTCTGVAGASDWFHGAFVTYSLEAKRRMLGVPTELLERHGAVSEPVARAMAEGALDAGGVELALSVTGVAGPGGGDVLVPVGTVWFGWSLQTGAGRVTETAVQRLDGGRARVRAAAVRVALAGAVDLLTGVART